MSPSCPYRGIPGMATNIRRQKTGEIICATEGLMGTAPVFVDVDELGFEHPVDAFAELTAVRIGPGGRIEHVSGFGGAFGQDTDLGVVAAGLVLYAQRPGTTAADIAVPLENYGYADRHAIAERMKSGGADPAMTQAAVELADRKVGDAPPQVAAWEWVKSGGWMVLGVGVLGVVALKKWL